MRAEKKQVLLDESLRYDLEEFCEVCGVHRELILAMVGEGMLTPAGASRLDWHFSASSVRIVQMTVRLQEDLRVNLPGAALALDLLAEIEDLKSQVR